MVDWDGLENRWVAPPSRGFESHPLRLSEAESIRPVPSKPKLAKGLQHIEMIESDSVLTSSIPALAERSLTISGLCNEQVISIILAYHHSAAYRPQPKGDESWRRPR